MIQKDIYTTLYSIFDVNELLYQVDGQREWIMYQLGNISDTLVLMYNRLTNERDDWKEVHTKEEILEALKKLKVKFKLFNINSDFEK